MGSPRNLLVIALLCISFLLIQQWQMEHAQKIHQPINHAAEISSDLDVPTQTDIIQTSAMHKLITVKNDLISLTIDTYGGDIVQAELLSYQTTLQNPQPLKLLENNAEFVYQAQSGLLGICGPDGSNEKRPVYRVQKDHYELDPDQAEIVIPLTYHSKQGIEIKKTFTLKRSNYAIEVAYSINNTTTTPIHVQLFGQLKQSDILPKERKENHFSLKTYRGAAYSTSDKRYQKYSFNNIKKMDLNQHTKGGWVAMLQHYFVTAWIPDIKDPVCFYSKNLYNKQAIIGFKSQPTLINPNQQQKLHATLWLGPELQEQMAQVAKNLDLTVDYGWLWFISQPLFKLLKVIQTVVKNWGLSIICITLIVRVVMYPLTKAQYAAMAKMRTLQPKLQAVRERCGNDQKRLNQEMISLYKNERINPLGGCLPLLIQMPIFLALYWMLSGSVELRHAPFVGWIRDLSSPDPYYILPLLMGLSMFIIQKMSPSSMADPAQQRIMSIMPIFFVLFFFWLPSGLVLYYVVSNIVTILQQQIIFYQLEKKGLFKR